MPLFIYFFGGEIFAEKPSLRAWYLGSLRGHKVTTQKVLFWWKLGRRLFQVAACWCLVWSAQVLVPCLTCVSSFPTTKTSLTIVAQALGQELLGTFVAACRWTSLVSGVWQRNTASKRRCCVLGHTLQTADASHRPSLPHTRTGG